MIEVGKYYILDNEKYYWSIDLQKKVKFNTQIVVKLTHTSISEILFGTLVDTGIFIDYNTNNEIEFTSNDIIGEYTFKKDENMPIFYMDF